MTSFRNPVKRLLKPFLWRAYRWYYARTRRYRFDGLDMQILPGVFHPALFISTHFLLKYLQEQQVEGKRFMELGCGSGLIALVAARSGAEVLASDINPIAIQGLEANAKTNHLSIQCITSDLFDAIPKQTFDYLFINPPYYPRDAQNDQERAFYCGTDFDYFKKLFQQLSSYIQAESQVAMVLSEDCDLAKIRGLAEVKGYQLEEVRRVQRVGEWNYIFLLRPDFF